MKSAFSPTTMKVWRPGVVRYENPAHPYEGKKTGTVKMLDVSELRALVDYGDQFLNDLRMVSDGTPLPHSEMNSPVGPTTEASGRAAERRQAPRTATGAVFGPTT
jgi:hypothetical protein